MDHFIIGALLFWCGYWLGCKHSEMAYRKWVDKILSHLNDVEEAADRLMRRKAKIIDHE